MTNRTLPLFLFFSLLTTTLFAQFDFKWAKNFDNDPAYGQSVNIDDQVVDAAGNRYVVGDFTRTADFDPGPGRLDYVPVNNNQDAFVGKYNSSGDLVWMFPLSTNGTDVANSITFAKDGNVLIAGTINGANLDLDPGPAEFLLPSSLFRGYFFAKYDVNGNFLWYKALEVQINTASVFIQDMETDSQGRIVITGGFSRSVDFDPGPGTAIATSNGVTTDFFIARYDSVGNLDFFDTSTFNFSISGTGLTIGPLDEMYMVTNAGRIYEYSPAGVNTATHVFNTSGNVSIYDIERDSQGNFVMGGTMNQGVDFDPGPALLYLTSTGFYDLWYGKFDASFSPIFIRKAGSPGVTYAGVSDIAIDGSDNFLITGYFEEQISLGGGLPVIGYSSSTGHNSYIAKFDPNGNGIFVHDYDGATFYSTSETVEIGLNNEVLYAPTLRGPVDMDPGAGTLTIAAPAGDAVLTRLDSSGNLQSAKALGTYPRIFAIDGVTDIAYDHQQNLLVTGYFEQAVDFDLGPAEFYLTSNGSQDIFLAKYDTLGSLIYAISVGGIGPDTAYAVTIDQAGNAYLTGNFSNSVDFAPGAPTLTLSSAGNTDIFMAAYDPSGNLLTAKKMGGSNVDCGRGIGIDTLGNVWLTGLFRGTVDFNPDAGVNSLASSGGGQDIFLAKYNAFGSFILARNVVSSGDDYGTSLCTKGGDVFITGTFTGTADFDLNAGTFNVATHGGTDAYYARYDGNANLISAFSLGGSGNDFGISVGADAAGNGFITGNYTGTIDLDPGAGTLSHTSAGNDDGFLAKYSPAGNLLFGNSVGGIGVDNVRDLFVNDGGEAYLTGGYTGTATFGPAGGTGTITSAGNFDAFIAGYDSTGAFKGATTIGGISLELGTAIAVNPTGNVVVGGNHEYRGDFDSGLGVTEVMALNFQDGFLTLFRECSGSVAPTTPTLQANSGTVCAGDTVVLKVVSGNLNDANVWQWYSGFCASTPVGQGDSIFVVPSANTTYYARGEGACIVPGFCASVSVNVVGGGTTTTYNTLTGCDSIAFKGTTYTASTVVTENLTSAAGCDSTVITTLTINQATTGTLTQSGCNSLTINGQTYTTSGTYIQTLTNVAGCDSTLTLNLTINQATSGTFTLTGCNSLTINSQTYTTSGIFTQTLTNTAGCDSILTLNLTINQGTTGTLTQSGCNSLTINGQTYTTSGTFTQTLTNTAGCDSTLTLNLTINQATSGTLTQAGCNSLTINGQTYTTSGTFTQTLTNNAGCDSTLTLNLTINQATSGTLTQTGCNSLTINGQTYTTSGTFTQTLTNTAGCDSILTLNLTINQATSGTLTQAGCNSLTINGQTYTTSGTFTQTLTNTAGCDSTLTLNLTINQATSGTLTQSGCNSLTINGQTFTTSGTFTQTLTNTAGCDSTLTLNLTINQATSGTLTQSGCNSLTINGQTYTTSGTFTQTLTNTAGCDSTLTLNLTINQGTSGTLTQSGCNSLTINGQTYTTSGTFTQTLTNTVGCDSTLTLNLTINQATSGTLTQSGCNSLTINGQTYTTSGTFTQTLTNAAGCDSTLTLNLTIGQATSGTLTQSGCNSLTINGQTYTNSGTFTQTLTNAAGCDSTLTLNLTINQATSGTLTQSGCNSLTINGQTYTTSGTFTQTLTNTAGCDSTLTLNLTINQATSGTLTQAGCNSLTINGQTYTTSGTFTQTLTSAAGCDSTLTLNLTIGQATSGTLAQSGCNSLTINGQTYTTSGTFTQTLTNTAGCDSTLTLNLTINQATSGTLTQSGCNSLTINGQTYTTSGTFTQTLTNNAGCDSTLTLNLTINQATSGTLTQAGCNSLTINGQTYTTSGTFTQTLTNAAGCDSTLTLNLTIGQTTSGTLTQSGCNSLTINGQTYTTSGTFTQTLTNAAGCDSTLTLNLTIGQGTAATITQTGCDSLSFNGTTYTASGIYTQTLVNSQGCDSLLTLDLTIFTAPIQIIQSGDTLFAQGTAISYQWIDCNSLTAVSGANNPFFVPTQSGTYGLVALQGTCSDTSNCISVVVVSRDNPALFPIVVFPNPNHGLATLKLPHGNSGAHVRVSTMGGQVILEMYNVNSDDYLIDISGHSNGMYLLEVTYRGVIQRFRLTKQ